MAPLKVTKSSEVVSLPSIEALSVEKKESKNKGDREKIQVKMLKSGHARDESFSLPSILHLLISFFPGSTHFIPDPFQSLNLVPRIFSVFKMAAQRRRQTAGHVSKNIRDFDYLKLAASFAIG